MSPTSIDLGDPVSWTNSDAGIVIADASDPDRGPRFTVAYWRRGAFTGHVTNIPTPRLRRISYSQLRAGGAPKP